MEEVNRLREQFTLDSAGGQLLGYACERRAITDNDIVLNCTLAVHRQQPDQHLLTCGCTRTSTASA